MNWEKIGAVAGVASAALAVIGLLVALVAWLVPQSPSAGPSETPAAAVTTTAAAATTTSAAPASAKNQYVEKYNRQLRLASPPMWNYDYVELDEGEVTTSGEHSRKTEFSYTYDGKFSTVLTSEQARVGLVESGVEQLTPERCAEKATTQAMGEPTVGEPGSPIKVGAGLCVVTGEGTVARVRIDSIGGPVDDVSKQPTIQLSVVGWKRG